MSTPRTPPRFVPTLTTVIDPESEAHNVVGETIKRAEAPPAASESSEKALPSVRPDPEVRHGIALDPATRHSEATALALEEHLLHRVLQRVDLSLEERLSDSVAAAVQAQLDVMVPRLRNEIEGVLRTLITDALARELADDTGSTLPENRLGLG